MTQATEGWSGRYTKVVAREVRRYREERGMSAQQFADACTDAGLPMKRSVIANFENGRRASVGVDELLVFARVLDVAPIHLMAPVGRAEWVEMQPGMHADPYRVAMWISGEVPLTADGTELWPLPLPKFRTIVRRLKGLRGADDVLATAAREYDEVGMTVEEAQRAVERALQAAADASHMADAAVMASIQARQRNDPDAIDDAEKEQVAAMAALQQAQREAAMASTKQAAISRLYSRVVTWRREREQEEEDIRRSLDELRAGGWTLPKLPEEYQYLLEPTKPERRRHERE